jgi:hypothetical protein
MALFTKKGVNFIVKDMVLFKKSIFCHAPDFKFDTSYSNGSSGYLIVVLDKYKSQVPHKVFSPFYLEFILYFREK